jgi:transposase
MPQTRSQAKAAAAAATAAEPPDVKTETPEPPTSQSGQLHAEASHDRKHSTIAQRSIALELWNQGLPTGDIALRSGLTRATFNALLRKARARGFQRGSKVLETYVEDAKRSGRPVIVTEDRGKEVIRTLTQNSTTRQFSLDQLSTALLKQYDWSASRMTLWRWLRKQGYSNVKLTTKPGLNAKQQLTRLRFAWERRDWSLEEWKKVIWSDETSVVLGSVRGKRRIWRLPSEAYHPHNIKARWKGRKEFMFWACFTYDHKGPAYAWGPETAAQKKKYDDEVKRWNQEQEPLLKTEWELVNGVRRIRLNRQIPGKKPAWRFTKKTGKWVRSSKGGIDAIRYRHEVLLPLYFPFLEGLPGSDWLAQEDNAAAHTSQRNKELWQERGFVCLTWPPNSPDLSPIEPAWYMLKRRTGSKKALFSRAQLVTRWHEEWKALPQEKLQRLVERLPGNIQWVLQLKGGNEYKEGSSPPEMTNQERGALYREIEALLAQPLPTKKGQREGSDWEDEVEEEDMFPN